MVRKIVKSQTSYKFSTFILFSNFILFFCFFVCVKLGVGSENDEHTYMGLERDSEIVVNYGDLWIVGQFNRDELEFLVDGWFFGN